jgi:hypothetical protein
MQDVHIVMVLIRFMMLMMEEELPNLVNYVIKKDILILWQILVHIVIILGELGHLQIREEFQVIVNNAKEKVLCLERN